MQGPIVELLKTSSFHNDLLKAADVWVQRSCPREDDDCGADVCKPLVLVCQVGDHQEDRLGSFACGIHS